MKFVLLLLILCGCCWPQDLGIDGPTGFNSTPARVGTPGFFQSCKFLDGMEELDCSGGGEFLFHHKRISFFSSYYQMDSLYRQVYSELDFSVQWKRIVVGGAYGFSMEWAPEVAKWSRHRYKAGISAIVGETYVSAVMSGWVSDFEKTWDGALGAGIRLSGLGLAFCEWDGTGFVLGNEISWKYLALKSSYHFPDFGVDVQVNFILGKWKPYGAYGFSSGKRAWFGVGFEKRI